MLVVSVLKRKMLTFSAKYKQLSPSNDLNKGILCKHMYTLSAYMYVQMCPRMRGNAKACLFTTVAVNWRPQLFCEGRTMEMFESKPLDGAKTQGCSRNNSCPNG